MNTGRSKLAVDFILFVADKISCVMQCVNTKFVIKLHVLHQYSSFSSIA